MRKEFISVFHTYYDQSNRSPDMTIIIHNLLSIRSSGMKDSSNRLKPFSKDDSKKLLTTLFEEDDLNVSCEVIKKIVKICGCHPYYM